MYFHLYQDDKREWCWSLHGGNHHKIASSGEGYHRKT